jgi:hypothetical protein
MSTELQQIASRTNGAKSHGPATDEGKQASSQNSRKHGLLSKKVVLEGESQEEFDELLTSYLDEHLPETPTERALIENMAVARWRQERVWTLETSAMENQMRNPRHPEGYADDEANDFSTRAYVAFHTLTSKSPSIEVLSRYEVRFERQFRLALNAFLQLRAARRVEEARRTRAGKPAAPAKIYPIDDANDYADDEAHDIAAAPSGSFGEPQNHRPQTSPTAHREPRPASEPHRPARLRTIY